LKTYKSPGSDQIPAELIQAEGEILRSKIYRLINSIWNMEKLPISGKSLGKRFFENVAQFRYLGTMITNQNLIQEEIKRKLNSRNACYHSVQNLSSSRLLYKNIKIRICKTIILPCGSIWV
jgi:hypothetical protein